MARHSDGTGASYRVRSRSPQVRALHSSRCSAVAAGRRADCDGGNWIAWPVHRSGYLRLVAVRSGDVGKRLALSAIKWPRLCGRLINDTMKQWESLDDFRSDGHIASRIGRYVWSPILSPDCKYDLFSDLDNHSAIGTTYNPIGLVEYPLLPGTLSRRPDCPLAPGPGLPAVTWTPRQPGHCDRCHH
jgi:hypothetical protein